MSASFKKDASRLAEDWGIKLSGVTHYTDERSAYDAAPSFGYVTAPNSGIPAIVNTMIDPQVIRTLITPTRSEEIYGSAKKGDRTNRTALFPVVENSGYAMAYGDFSEGGDSSANANWVPRQSFYYQTWAKYGDLESEMMGTASIGWVNEQRVAAASVLNKASNLLNLFGLSGIELYGALNDPSLPTPIQPTAKAGTANAAWTSTGDPNAIYQDIVALFAQLNVQMMGNINNSTPLKLVIPAERSQVLMYTNQFGITLQDMLSKGFPNITIETLPEAGPAMSGGYQSTTLVQLFVPTVDGVETVFTAFTEKLTMHRLEQYSTNQRQKMTQGGWGTIIRRPYAFAQMAGV